MTWNEGRIAAAISRQTLARKCVVLVDRCQWTGHECDVLAVTVDLRIIDIEIKISRADLKADAAKDKWWHRAGGLYWRHGGTRPPDVHRDWPPKVWKHYFAVPAEIWTDALFECLPSPRSGVLLVSARAGMRELSIECRRRTTANKDAGRLKPEQVMDIARLANLRMWDSYMAVERMADDHRRAMAAAHPVSAQELAA